MIDVRFHYLEKPAKLARAKVPFGTTYAETLRHLERELGHLGAKQITIRAGFQQVRLDGWPFSNARAEHPAVILEFMSKGRLLAFRGFRYESFEGNLRAICLTLQALRAIDRYEVTSSGEQYAGFTALPAAEPADTRKAAAAFISQHSNIFVSHENTSAEALDRAYKAAARSLHPDLGGNHDLFVKLQAAKATLERAA